MRRLPLEPLMVAAQAPSFQQLAQLIGVDNRVIYRARRDGLSWIQADRFAVTVGHHPSTVWGDLWFEPDECRRGHLYDDDNTYWTPADTRQCRRCHADNKRLNAKTEMAA